MKYDAIVLGGGLYGCKVAMTLRSMGMKNVMLMEPDKLLGMATETNQNRVHGGYHYPRSVLTANSARKNYIRFLTEYALAVEPNDEHLYAIAEGSQTSPEQFEKVCAEIGAPLEPIPLPVIFNPKMFQAAYRVEEVSFNIRTLRRIIKAQLGMAGVVVVRGRGRVTSWDDNRVIVVDFQNQRTYDASYVFNCTYAGLESIGVPITTQLKKEWTEVAIVKAPPAMEHTDLTIMDGPFWSLMRFPSWGEAHALTHVKYTPHYEWFPQTPEQNKWLPDDLAKPSQAPLMIEDAARYVPVMAEAKHLTSLYTTRVVLAQNETDDGRPVLWEYSPQSARIISILGSKFNSIYDVADKLHTGEWYTPHKLSIKLAGRRALIGRGFVGSNLDKSGRFTERYNSQNINYLTGHFRQLVIAAPSAEKWWANLNPDEDMDSILELQAALCKCEADEVILISTIDVLDTDARNHYGFHRKILEGAILTKFPHAKIFRLPALYGPGLKKNALYDLLHGNTKNIVAEDCYQWYNVQDLWTDMHKVHASTIVNIVPEPVSMGWIAAFAQVQVPSVVYGNAGHRRPISYDYRTPDGGYTADKESVMQGLGTYIMEYKRCSQS